MTYQLMLFPDFKEKAVTLSYDDGTRHDIRLVEIMNKYGLKGTFNLNSGRLDRKDYVRADELKGLYIDSGNEVAVHGVKHLTLTAVPNEQIVQEIAGDRKALEAILGDIVTGMAYANGAYDDRVVEVLKTCGIDYSRTVECDERFRVSDDWLRWKATCHHNHPKLFELVDAFLAETPNGYFWARNPKLFYLWGHSYEFAGQDNWQVIEEFAKKIGGREDVWYATNGEIFRYVEAYKALRYSADGRVVYNPSAITVYARTAEGKEAVFPAGERVKT